MRKENCPLAPENVHTHTHTYDQIHICMRVCSLPTAVNLNLLGVSSPRVDLASASSTRLPYPLLSLVCPPHRSLRLFPSRVFAFCLLFMTLPGGLVAIVVVVVAISVVVAASAVAVAISHLMFMFRVNVAFHLLALPLCALSLALPFASRFRSALWVLVTPTQ